MAPPVYFQLPKSEKEAETVKTTNQQQLNNLESNNNLHLTTHRRRSLLRAVLLSWIALFLLYTLVRLVADQVLDDEPEESKPDSDSRYQQEFRSPFRPHLSDNNGHFSGPGFPDRTETPFEDPVEELDNLKLSESTLGFDAWNDEGAEIPSNPPTVYDKAKDAFVPIERLGTSKPSNMLVRPAPSRTGGHLHGKCYGPANYKWDGPEKIVIDVEEFRRIYMLSKSLYINAEFNFKENNEHTDGSDDEVIIRPDIRFVDPEFNQLLEVTEQKNDAKKSFVFRVAVPSWDRTKLGRSDCIFAKFDVTLPKKTHELELLGAGAYDGKVDYGNLPENVAVETLVGWTGNGPVHITSAPKVEDLQLATNNGAIFAHKLSVSKSLRSKIVNGPHELSVVPTGEEFTLKAASVKGGIDASVDETFAGKFRIGAVNGKTTVTGDDVELDGKTLSHVTGKHGDGAQKICLKTINGYVNLEFKSIE